MNRDAFAISLGGYAIPRVVETEISVPGGLAGLRLAFFTDIHMGCLFMNAERTGRLIMAVAALKPDIVIVGGDFAEGGQHGAFFELLGQLSPPLGMYGVLGNNDIMRYRENPSGFIRDARRSGLSMLINEFAHIRRGGDSLYIYGVDDPIHGEPDMGPVSGRRPDAGAVILVAHSPTALGSIQGEIGAELILSGHTHGGQAKFMGISPYSLGYEGARKLKNFRLSGEHMLGSSKLIVSNGIGTSKIPLRLGAPPEIHLVNFSSK